MGEARLGERAADGGATPAAALSRLLELAGDTARQRLLVAHPELASRQTVGWLCDAAVAELRADLERAERLTETASWLAARLDEDFSWGRCLRAEANLLNFRRDYAGAARRYEEAVARFRRAGDPMQAAITRVSGVVSLISLGRYRQACGWLAAARPVFEAAGDRLRLARLEFAQANLHARQDRFEEALAGFRAALVVFEAAGRPYDVGMCLRNVAVCLQDLNELRAAGDAYRGARDYCGRHRLPLLVLEIDYNLAHLYYLRGDYNEALRMFERARQSCLEQGDPHHRALCDLDEAEISLELNLVDEAERLARRGGEGFERLGMGYESAKCLTFEALALARQGKRTVALERLTAARRIFVREGNAVWPGRIDLYRATLLYELGHATPAGRLARRALAACKTVPSRAAACHLLLARLQLLEGDAPGAARRCARVLKRLAALELPALSYQLEVVRGRAEEQRGRAEVAWEAYLEAHRSLERLRSHLQTEELRIAFLEDKLEVYEGLVWLAARERRDPALAFAWAEAGKSRALAELMAFRAHAVRPRTAAPRAVRDLRRLRREINARHRRLDLSLARGGAEEAERAERLRQSCGVKERELLRALRGLHSADPEYAALQAGAAADLESIRRVLPEEATLIEYFVARGALLAGVLSRRVLRVVEVSDDVERAVEHHRVLRFQLAKFARGREYVAARSDFIESATRTKLQALERELIAPLRPYLEDRHLVVVPHGFLHYVPFHALLAGDRYLIDQFTISYAPSASVLYYCGSRRPTRNRGSLVLGIADRRAPMIREEARRAAGRLPDARLLLGAEASVANLRRHGPGARYLHIATHGTFRRDSPLFSGIQLGSGRLNLFDLYDLRLDADLVVLSGCGTGLNVVRGGDELVGLARGFLYAGTRAMIASLWDLDDRCTCTFMDLFYRAWRRPGPPHHALRQAMLELRDREPHPYYWAPFLLTGYPWPPA